MNVPHLKRMTAEEYAAWPGRPQIGRFELIDGMVVQMNSERLVHGRVKTRVSKALERALERAALQGEVLWDGMAVRISDTTVHEPDTMVRLGAPLPDDTIFVTDPVIVVEVLSPSTGPVDTSRKLTNYFLLPSLQHYLVVDTTKQLILHYVRGPDDRPVMNPPVGTGEIQLTPPGLSLSLSEIFPSPT